MLQSLYGYNIRAVVNSCLKGDLSTFYLGNINYFKKREAGSNLELNNIFMCGLLKAKHFSVQFAIIFQTKQIIIKSDLFTIR